MKKLVKLLGIFIIFFCSANNMFGLNVSILVVQNNGTDKISEASKVFENQVLNYMFDNGHIVSNEPISLFENYEIDSIKGFDAAVDGFVDFYVEIIIDYDMDKSSNPEAVILSNIRSVKYVIKKVNDGTVFFESEKLIPNLNGISNQNVGFNNFATKIAENINSKLSGK